MTEEQKQVPKPTKKEILKIKRKITDGMKKAESYGSGLACEKLIVASYDLLTIPQLEQTRYLLNQIIKKKKIYKRANKNEPDKTSIRHAKENSRKTITKTKTDN